MTIWNLHGTGIQLLLIHSHLHALYFDLSFICSNIRSFFRCFTHSLSLSVSLTRTFYLTLSFSYCHSHTHARSLSLSLSLLAAIKQLCCHSCALLALTRSFVRSISFTLTLDLARSLVSLLNVRISCQIIYLVFFVLFFVYSVCLYSYNNHFPNDYTLNSSNFLHFFTNNNWIVAPNFLSAHFFVIEFAIVFVAVPMHSAKQSSTTALETWKRSSSRQQKVQVRTKYFYQVLRI